MTGEKYYIYLSNWWPGFENKSDANHVGFFEYLFSYTGLRNCEITKDLSKANILLEAGKPDSTLRSVKHWKYKINFIGEPDLPNAKDYDLVLTSVKSDGNIVDLPLVVMYIHCNNFLPLIQNRCKITTPARAFCTFIVSNPKCAIRNKLFNRLNEYKKVSSMGRYANNTGGVLHAPYWSQTYFNVIAGHKFMICGENTKMTTYSTEKIANPYIAGTIPIYWGSHNIKNIFNKDSMLFLEDETEESFNKLISKVIELDEDDDKYLEFINRPAFNQHTDAFWRSNYTMDALGNNIDTVLGLH
jgi:hypothetical protein